MFAAIQAVAPSLRVEVNPVNMPDAGEIKRAVAAFARVITSVQRRRRWSAAEKERLVAASLQ